MEEESILSTYVGSPASRKGRARVVKLTPAQQTDKAMELARKTLEYVQRFAY